MRKKSNVTITVHNGERSYPVICRNEQSILEALIANDQYFSAFCGGAGVCGKCRVRVIAGELPATSYDEKIFTEEEVLSGWRLSCKAVPKGDCEIELKLNDENTFEVAAEDVGKVSGDSSDAKFGIACDIGTTTIAMSLVNLVDKEVYAVYTSVNHQRMYGADVISRIQASNEGKGLELQKSIRKDLLSGIRDIIDKSGIDRAQIQKVIVAGNTTMGHLLMGYSCETLGVSPFTPVNIGIITDSCEKILGEAVLSCPVTLIPGISAFVGADITAGILAYKISEREEISLLIDLGTNGEMAIGNKDRIMVTSTAAGPAFEGGNIGCGMGSVQGAISGVRIEGGEAAVTTIGDKPPVGICGTGVIETVAELVRTGLVDETGLLDESLEEGFLLGYTPEGEKILFTGKDVREVQLAKAAVRAGAETLMLRFGVTAGQIDKVYLAGGFGLKIDQNKAIEIGLLPEKFRGKIEAVGNSSLKGAVNYLLEEEARIQTEEIIRISEEVNLSGDKDFNELYMEYMFFE